jgi:hypothetical protein
LDDSVGGVKRVYEVNPSEEQIVTATARWANKSFDAHTQRPVRVIRVSGIDRKFKEDLLF